MGEEKKAVSEIATKKALIAKKDFIICQNEYVREIKAGDDLSEIPEVYIQNLKTERVI